MLADTGAVALCTLPVKGAAAVHAGEGVTATHPEVVDQLGLFDCVTAAIAVEPDHVAELRQAMGEQQRLQLLEASYGCSLQKPEQTHQMTL